MLINRAYYTSTIHFFLKQSSNAILGELSKNHRHDLVQLQTNAWLKQIEILKEQLNTFANSENNTIFFEFGIPRMGKRADVVLVINGLVFVIEFKVGAREYARHNKEQAIDYALDLKHFHQGSHKACIVPVLLATDALTMHSEISINHDGLVSLLCVNKSGLTKLINRCIERFCTSVTNTNFKIIESSSVWAQSSYKPTPTIIQAAQALYQGHQVEEISRSDAGAENLSKTADAINSIIEFAKTNHEKVICFVTGVPGAGKTLAGLNIATNRKRAAAEEHAVFLSGNGPLVDVLREGLARDDSKRKNISISNARRSVTAFIQNIHHFRDGNLNIFEAPIERVVLFDEAQRAWNKDKTAKFMQQKRDQPDFDLSEPEFLIQVMDRHKDWCVIVALIGGGQEINTGEAGLPEWFSALRSRYKHWRVYYSDEINRDEYIQDKPLKEHVNGLMAEKNDSLHLGVSIRSFRAEKLSEFVGYLINNQPKLAKNLYHEIKDVYPIVLTRNISVSRQWLLNKARGSELFGLVASSGANRLRPEGVFVKAKISPVDWFLNGKHDVRACQYLEDVATEFDIQGLELDWVGVCWDADFRFVFDENGKGCWDFNSFKGTKWMKVKSEESQKHLANSYRVLLTRARQGMIIYVPKGNEDDPTRPIEFYDGIYNYLISCGLENNI